MRTVEQELSRQEGISKTLSFFSKHLAESIVKNLGEEQKVMFKEVLEQMEVEVIREVVEQVKGNKSLASKLLGLSRAAVIYKLKERDDLYADKK